MIFLIKKYKNKQNNKKSIFKNERTYFLHGENVAGSIPMWKIFDGLNMMRDIKVFVSARKFDNF